MTIQSPNHAATFAPQLRVAEDTAMIRAAAQVTRDLAAARPAIYWADFLGSALLGYTGLALAMTASGWLAVLAGVVAVLALYRAGLFTHEIAHLRPGAVPGFRTAWNFIIGVPLLVPSFMYENVHSIHHTRIRYGTAEDPEYLPLALMKPWTVPMFAIVAVLAPIALLLRFGILAPLSLVIPPLRRMLVARYSSLSINPEFRRRAPEGAFARHWAIWETAASLWAMTLLALVVTGVVPLREFAIALAVVSAVTVLNQVRTLVAHLWENDGEQLTVTGQYLDSVNVPPPGLLPALWAPVGLRYHALHHLLPGVPYHALGEAHRRIQAAVPADSPYHVASYPGLTGLVVRLVRGGRRP
ncbi:fatty acid desaturase family protein [Polymorphobacter fuscus]|uniref:Fatty acid desaturase n=1 Tax=Sandarakinorhabdus fusca TaxID=1439888 RepID=A0A7C9GPN4_9SPHN|nr:fatty acid desaturase [Polymorphobacter fuscus]KAB7646432.1 fatty acid desaturase [Polymorphobacter fuscus]MQT17672.1 fatty acid desaturase [Polymorphobacter fuscus]NJC09783.1 fatty acid desaturase [Polymorphobacter fuscus]